MRWQFQRPKNIGLPIDELKFYPKFENIWGPSLKFGHNYPLGKIWAEWAKYGGAKESFPKYNKQSRSMDSLCIGMMNEGYQIVKECKRTKSQMQKQITSTKV